MAAPIEVLASAGVILSDGASVTISVRVLFDTTPGSVSSIQDQILAFFNLDGMGVRATLSNLKNDPNYTMALCEKIKGIKNAKFAAVTGYVVTSPPIESFLDKSKEVTAILASGETIKLKFASPVGMPPPPSTSDVQKVFELLSSLQRSQLGQIQQLINDKLLPPNNGWSFMVLGLEQISCPCGK